MLQKTLQINQHPHFKPSVQKKARCKRKKSTKETKAKPFSMLALKNEKKKLRGAILRVLQRGGL